MNLNCKKRSNKKIIITGEVGFYICFSILVLFSTVHFLFALMCLLFSASYVISKNNTKVVPFIVYGTFFASIFKIPSITNISFFTIILFLFVIKVINSLKLKSAYLLLFCALFCFAISVELINGYFDISRNIKFFSNFIYLYFVVKSISYQDTTNLNLNYNSIFNAHICGVIISSFYRFLDGGMFKISQFVSEKSSNLGHDTEYFVRFSGLYGDPNYYAVNVIIALCIVVFLYIKGEKNEIITAALFSVLFGFAIMTRSKSTFLMLLLPIIMLLYANAIKGKITMNVVIIGVITCIIILTIKGKITWFDFVLSRFSLYSNNVNELTTGRYNIWQSYIDYFKNNNLKLLFGAGLSTPLFDNKAAHNTYIDILYHLGVIPGLIYIYTVICLFKINKSSIKRTIINYSGILTILIMYFFLSCLFDIDFATNCIVMIVMFNTPVLNSEAEIFDMNIKEGDKFE